MILRSSKLALLLALSIIVKTIMTSAFQMHPRTTTTTTTTRSSIRWAYDTDSAPSDYDFQDLTGEKAATVDENEEDASIRDALKRELLLLSSVTNRGEYCSKDEQNILVDLVAQLEALNPTANPARNCQGEWDLCLSSTQFFRSSPFFQSLRVAINDKALINNGFELHDRASTASRIGRVRQTIDDNNKLTSSVDLQVGIPLLPLRVEGTVVTTATMKVVSDDLAELQIVKTQVRGSNIPFLNEYLEDPLLDMPMGDLYQMLNGEVPVVPMKTYYGT
jgi:hypothetical protein